MGHDGRIGALLAVARTASSPEHKVVIVQGLRGLAQLSLSERQQIDLLRTLGVAADPKRPSSVVQIAVEDVERMIPSKVSMMPKDLLNTLSLEEVLDLLAFIESAGDPGHAVYQTE